MWTLKLRAKLNYVSIYWVVKNVLYNMWEKLLKWFDPDSMDTEDTFEKAQKRILCMSTLLVKTDTVLVILLLNLLRSVQIKKTLNEREKYWIAELNTVYPYGLNMDASFAGIKNAFEHVNGNKVGKTIYSVFNVVKSTRGYSGGRKKRHLQPMDNSNVNNRTFDSVIWLNEIMANHLNDENIVHSLRTEISKLMLYNLKRLFLDITIKIKDGEKFNHVQHSHIFLVIRDLCLHKLQTLYKPKRKSFIVIEHVNKIVEKVNLNHIFKDIGINSLFPVKSELHSTPTVSYKYSKSVRSLIVNYGDVISDPNHEHFVCNCKSYPGEYIDTSHGHIVTGDMNIVDNIPLKNLLNKGLGYHDQQAPNKEEALKAIKAGLDSYISFVSSTLSTPIKAFIGWKNEILRQVNNKLVSVKSYEYNNILSQKDVKKALGTLHKDFVLVPVDKASKNIAIICKKYYIDVLNEEIENSPTFEHVSDDPDSFLDNLKTSLNVKFDNDNIPSMYATAKMHKIPKKFRYITSARNTIFSNVSENVGLCLKLLLKFARKSFKYRLQGIDNCIFIVDNRDKSSCKVA